MTSLTIRFFNMGRPDGTIGFHTTFFGFFMTPQKNIDRYFFNSTELLVCCNLPLSIPHVQVEETSNN